MSVKKLNLVRYGGDYWVTLADYTITRDATGYSDHASVKSAIRTFVVKTNPDKYIAFRGEAQLKNIVSENKNNPLFYPEDFRGTRTALIQFDMLNLLNDRFPVSDEYKEVFKQFIQDCIEYMNKQNKKEEDTEGDTSRSVIVRQLRQELNRLDKEIEVRQNNREKILQALNALESLDIEVSI